MLKNVLPQHIAVIMDGNGRWAAERKLPRHRGHLEGVKRVEEVVQLAVEKKIQVLTLFAFSTENWTRPQNEISTLMKILISVLNKKVQKLNANNIRLQFLGRRKGIPKEVLTCIDSATKLTKNNKGLILNVAFNYGARLEILEAVKSIATAVQKGEMEIKNINEETFSDALYTKGLPDPDLLIRTSGEKRISNFLLWQLSYAELYFSKKYWPDFNEGEFQKSLDDFKNRERRYGNVGFLKD